ncbi:MAG: hypothetical protein LBV08_10780 [Clostridiales bacterium]|jgi:hypothetical protein|nr:hypothetical protein [Clostridiales bacterium]
MQINNMLTANLKLQGVKPSDILKYLDGTLIKGEIISIENSDIALKIGNGQIIKGKLGADVNLAKFKLNSTMEFNVQVAGNKIILSPGNKPMLFKQPGGGSVEEFLRGANLPLNQKNYSLVDSLIENNLSITKENVIKLNQNLNQAGSLKHAVFLLKNDIKPVAGNISILNELINHENTTGSQLEEIFKQIEGVKNPELKEKLVDIFFKDNTNEDGLDSFKGLQPKEEIRDTDKGKGTKEEYASPAPKKSLKEENAFLRSKSAFDFINSEPEGLDNFLKGLKEKVGLAKQLIINTENPENLDTGLTKLQNTLDFFINAKENIFVQIPLLLEGKKFDSEIYVFEDKKQKVINGGDCTALISIETANLGRFETFIKKVSDQVNFEFNLNEEAEALVKANIDGLEHMLKERGYTLAGFSFKKTKDEFDITQTTKEDNTKFVSFDFMA